MSVSCSSPTRGALRSLTRAGLLVAALSAGACTTQADATTTVERTAAAAPPPGTTSFSARARQHLVITAKPSASAAAVEDYFKANVLPSLVHDRRIGDVATYVDSRTGSYIIELELRTPSPAQLSLAVDVLSVGRTQPEAERIIAEFSKYFDASNVQLLTARADLSLARGVIGTVEGVKP
jgi:hypothetical protein